ncbi:hypothetical protein RMN56_14785 [Micromonospora halotolerans]|uniref:DUF2029 domain-containing protein n=1 Tax=Micromonospora halotolerans TaxID=709879 RepID=A0ABZ0A5P1_9ACTN|nr:hypothetical protein [Micromonospora halotolerans]WNM42520.1 hypothetical protein RMN56_14785 [Micromonospora halotolerans]
MTELERRYRWLLRAYPRAYRQYRADEMLETLLATADNTRRPSLREAAALVVGGLRARTGVDRLGSRSALGHSALRLSALSLLVYGLTLWAGGPISFLVTVPSEGPYNLGTWWFIIIPALLVIALFAAAWGSYRLAFGAAISTVVAQHLSANWWTESLWSIDGLQGAISPRFWPALLASLALLPLLRAARTPVGKPWAWPVLAALAVVALTPSPINGWSDAPLMSLYAFAALAVITAPIDARMPIVASALLLVPALQNATYELYFRQAGWELGTTGTTILVLAAVMVITLAAGTVTGRRQARM